MLSLLYLCIFILYLYFTTSQVMSICFLQAVNQSLLAAPLVPPQLTLKEFYMTGTFVTHTVYYLFYIFINTIKPPYVVIH